MNIPTFRGNFEDTDLPDKDIFYSSLTETQIDDDDYEHAKKVWDHFRCQILGQYSDIYLKVDILLLADIFKNFRDICISTQYLDPGITIRILYYIDCMLKYTNIKLEPLSDYEMQLIFENGKQFQFLIFVYFNKDIFLLVFRFLPKHSKE